MTKRKIGKKREITEHSGIIELRTFIYEIVL